MSFKDQWGNDIYELANPAVKLEHNIPHLLPLRGAHPTHNLQSPHSSQSFTQHPSLPIHPSMNPHPPYSTPLTLTQFELPRTSHVSPDPWDPMLQQQNPDHQQPQHPHLQHAQFGPLYPPDFNHSSAFPVHLDFLVNEAADQTWVHNGSISLLSSPSINAPTLNNWNTRSVSSGSQTSRSDSINQSPPPALAVPPVPVKLDILSKVNKKSRAKLLDEKEQALMEKDDSELTEDELAIKKKAQNRLAQRAFRERKETKLKELENKLLQSEEERQKLLEKLDSIRLQYITVRTENNFLRSGESAAALPPASAAASLTQPKFSFPKTQSEFINEMVGDHPVDPETINKVYENPQNTGSKVLAVGAVWDYLQIKSENNGYENVDLAEVMQLLRGKERCHGYGPAYPLELVDQAINQIRDANMQ